MGPRHPLNARPKHADRGDGADTASARTSSDRVNLSALHHVGCLSLRPVGSSPDDPSLPEGRSQIECTDSGSSWWKTTSPRKPFIRLCSNQNSKSWASLMTPVVSCRTSPTRSPTSSALQRDLRFTRARRAASGGLLLGTFASRWSALLQLLPQAVGLDQHILRISKLVLPLEAEAAKVGPVSLFALREPLDRFSKTPPAD